MSHTTLLNDNRGKVNNSGAMRNGAIVRPAVAKNTTFAKNLLYEKVGLGRALRCISECL